jgi:hypothetical protein
VWLETGGAQVAGTQNDLVWDGSCATLSRASDCRVNPTTGKLLHGTILAAEDFRYRGLVLSLLDTEPIPDGQLYCCAFSVEATPGACCSVEVVNTGVSDPLGGALLSSGNTAQLCVAAGAGVASPTPTATPTIHGDLVRTDSSGCQISPAPSGEGTFLIAMLLPLLLLRRRSPLGLAMKGASP